jgi:hypothetical protein
MTLRATDCHRVGCDGCEERWYGPLTIAADGSPEFLAMLEVEHALTCRGRLYYLPAPAIEPERPPRPRHEELKSWLGALVVPNPRMVTPLLPVTARTQQPPPLGAIVPDGSHRYRVGPDNRVVRDEEFYWAYPPASWRRTRPLPPPTAIPPEGTKVSR